MISVIQRFMEAHDYCRALENILPKVADAEDRDALRMELLKAYDELDRKAQAIIGVRFAESTTFSATN